MTNGFFIVHRELFDKLWFRQLGPKAIGVIHLIARAQWGEGTLKNGRKLGRGQCVVGRKEFSDATGLSEKEVRTLFTVLQNVDFAAIEGANEGTVVTLKNYDYYQDIRNFITPPGASEGPAKGPARGQPGASEGPLIKEDNTKKEYKYMSDFERLWTAYPKKDGKKQALRSFKASVKTDDDLIAVEKALACYLEELRANNTPIQYTKNGSTFFNNWQDKLPAQVSVQNSPKRRVVSATATYGATND